MSASVSRMAALLKGKSLCRNDFAKSNQIKGLRFAKSNQRVYE